MLGSAERNIGSLTRGDDQARQKPSQHRDLVNLQREAWIHIIKARNPKAILISNKTVSVTFAISMRDLEVPNLRTPFS